MTHRSAFLLVLLVSLTAVRGLSQDTSGAPGINKALQSELLKMGEEDQKNRGKIMEAMRKQRESGKAAVSPEETKALWDEQVKIDRKNLARLEEIIQKHGWPGKSLVGEQAAGVAFLIVQHADHEPMKKYFPLLKEAAAKGEAQPQDAAMMEDRILMNEGKKQVYGTQLRSNELWPIEDEENVDTRRAAVGLPPLAEYLKYFGIDYKPPVKK